MFHVRNNRGASLIELIVAMGAFGILASAIVSATLGGLSGLNTSGERLQAEGYADEAIEAVRSVRDDCGIIFSIRRAL